MSKSRADQQRWVSRKLNIKKGPITPDEDELACALLGPKWVDYPVYERTTMKLQGAIGNTKIRWSRISNGSPQEQEEDKKNFPEEPNLDDDQKLSLIEDRLIYNYKTHTLDLRNRRVTDIKDCPRVCLPPSRPETEEIQLHTKEALWC